LLSATLISAGIHSKFSLSPAKQGERAGVRGLPIERATIDGSAHCIGVVFRLLISEF